MVAIHNLNKLTWGLILGFIVLIVILIIFPISNLDVFWHMANGRAMVNEGGIVSTEIFSFTAFGKEFDNHEWLAQIVLYLIYNFSGSGGLLFFKVLISLTSLAFLYRASIRSGAYPLVAALACFSAVYVGLHRFTVRPHLITFLALSIFLYFIYKENRNGFKREIILGSVLLLIVWNWFHGPQLGLAMLAVFTAGQYVEFLLQKKFSGRFLASGNIDFPYIKRLGLQFVVILLLINLDPLGANPYKMIPRLLESSFMLNYTGEFMPPPFSWLFMPFWIYFGFVSLLVCQAVYKKQVRIFELFILFLFAVLALRYSRAIALFALVSVPFVAVQCTKILEYLQVDTRQQLKRGLIGFCLVGPLFLTLYFKVYSLDRYPHPYYLGVGFNESVYPVGAARFVKLAGLNGRMYNSQKFGAYAAYHLAPERKIFVYNLPPVFGGISETIHRPEDLVKWDINYAIVGENLEFKFIFKQDQWIPVFAEENAIVMLKKTPENLPLLKKYIVRYFTPQINAEQVGELIKQPFAGARLAHEMSYYLSCKKDERVAGLFASLITRSSVPLSVKYRLKLLKPTMGLNGENLSLMTAQRQLQGL